MCIRDRYKLRLKHWFDTLFLDFNKIIQLWIKTQVFFQAEEINLQFLQNLINVFLFLALIIKVLDAKLYFNGKCLNNFSVIQTVLKFEFVNIVLFEVWAKECLKLLFIINFEVILDKISIFTCSKRYLYSKFFGWWLYSWQVTDIEHKLKMCFHIWNFDQARTQIIWVEDRLRAYRSIDNTEKWQKIEFIHFETRGNILTLFSYVVVLISINYVKNHRCHRRD